MYFNWTFIVHVGYSSKTIKIFKILLHVPNVIQSTYLIFRNYSYNTESKNWNFLPFLCRRKYSIQQSKIEFVFFPKIRNFHRYGSLKHVNKNSLWFIQRPKMSRLLFQYFQTNKVFHSNELKLSSHIDILYKYKLSFGSFLSESVSLQVSRSPRRTKSYIFFIGIDTTSKNNDTCFLAWVNL